MDTDRRYLIGWFAFLLFVVGVLIVGVAYQILNRGAVCTSELINARMPNHDRNQIVIEVSHCIGAFVSEHGRLPNDLDEVSETSWYECFLKDYEKDQVRYGYQLLDPEHALLRSVGFDGVDDEGKILYDKQHDRLLTQRVLDLHLLQTHPELIEQGTEELELLKGDLVLFLSVVHSATDDTPRLSASWLEPPREVTRKDLRPWEYDD